jgi:hypothetical protein
VAAYDQVIFQVVREAEADLEKRLNSDVMYFNSEIRMNLFAWFREIVERLARRLEKKDALAIFLTTPGGQQAVEKLVEVTRHHYNLMYFVVPVATMSSGTIFCLSGDKIYMDYSSSLGPVDPKAPDREGKYLVTALVHLDKIREIIDKSANNTITPVEFEWLMRQDLAMLRFYEQARDLSVALLKRWLVQYKFKDWLTRSGHQFRDLPSGRGREGGRLERQVLHGRVRQVLPHIARRLSGLQQRRQLRAPPLRCCVDGCRPLWEPCGRRVLGARQAPSTRTLPIKME